MHKIVSFKLITYLCMYFYLYIWIAINIKKLKAFITMRLTIVFDKVYQYIQLFSDTNNRYR